MKVYFKANCALSFTKQPEEVSHMLEVLYIQELHTNLGHQTKTKVTTIVLQIIVALHTIGLWFKRGRGSNKECNYCHC